jgi:hypothetical protein
VRIACLRTAANPDTRAIRDTADAMATISNISPEAGASIAEASLLEVPAHTADRELGGRDGEKGGPRAHPRSGTHGGRRRPARNRFRDGRQATNMPLERRPPDGLGAVSA